MIIGFIWFKDSLIYSSCPMFLDVQLTSHYIGILGYFAVAGPRTGRSAVEIAKGFRQAFDLGSNNPGNKFNPITY